VVLGFATLYAAWIQSEINQTLRLYNQFEQILVARNTLAERPWNDGAEVTVESLTEIDSLFFFNATVFAAGGKMTTISCEDEETQRDFFLVSR
jgi:hypothetical protein